MFSKKLLYLLRNFMADLSLYYTFVFYCSSYAATFTATQRALPFFTEFFLARNEIAEVSCQSESEAKICTEKLPGTR